MNTVIEMGVILEIINHISNEEIPLLCVEEEGHMTIIIIMEVVLIIIHINLCLYLELLHFLVLRQIRLIDQFILCLFVYRPLRKIFKDPRLN